MLEYQRTHETGRGGESGSLSSPAVSGRGAETNVLIYAPAHGDKECRAFGAGTRRTLSGDRLTYKC